MAICHLYLGLRSQGETECNNATPSTGHDWTGEVVALLVLCICMMCCSSSLAVPLHGIKSSQLARTIVQLCIDQG